MLTPTQERTCNDSLWIADRSFQRIIKYNTNSTTPQLVLGQPNFHTLSNISSASTFTYPVDIVFSTDCSIAFVADNHRILRFRAPFFTGMEAEGVIGARDFETNKPGIGSDSFNRTYRIQLEDHGNNTGTLYVLDYGNRRIVSGTTNWKIPGYFLNIPCGYITNNGTTCTVLQPIPPLINATLESNYTLIIISSSLNLTNTSITIMTTNQQFQVSGNITFGGELIIILDNQILNELGEKGSVNIVLFKSSSMITGTFNNVTLTNDDSRCGSDINMSYGDRSLEVLVKQRDCGEGRAALGKGAIAGIVIGGVVGVACVVVLVGVVIGGVAAYKRRRMLSEAKKVGGKL
eukprot:TRINITY_DN12969_c0_g2_i1.p1 TRINITY_DN12969_c0_g2~~TRINITY_DN12969_c0_g2_i1.p1  ORF type:complete len:347 (-),score=73.47 TRINITY_DN12969_c0_g2_i1:126-1166(-)